MHVAQDARPIAKKHDSKIAHNSTVSPSLLEQGLLKRALDSPEPHSLTWSPLPCHSLDKDERIDE